MSTFVSVGNATQPFTRLLEAVAALAPQLPQPVIIQYGAATGFAAEGCRCVDYLDMDSFARHVAEARLLILHVGAGSVLHAIRAGKVPLVVPRLAALGEHVDDHQSELARELHKLGKVVACTDVAGLSQCVAQVLALPALRADGGELPLVGELRTLLRHHDETLAGGKR